MPDSSFCTFGSLFRQFVLLATALCCTACGGGGSGDGERGGEGDGLLVPPDGAPVVLTIEGDGFRLSATCAPYRPGDYSGIVSDGALVVRALPDGTCLQADSLSGSWEQGLSAIAERVEPLHMELEGQGSDGAPVSLRLDELSLEVSERKGDGRASGRVLKGQLVVDRQATLLLDGGYSFTTTPQR